MVVLLLRNYRANPTLRLQAKLPLRGLTWVLLRATFNDSFATGLLPCRRVGQCLTASANV